MRIRKKICNCGCNEINHWCGYGFCSGDFNNNNCECKEFVENTHLELNRYKHKNNPHLYDEKEMATE